MGPKENRPELSVPEVVRRLQAEMEAILESRPVVLAYAYGSVVDGYAAASSDVDIALVLKTDGGLSAYERMQLEFNIAAEVEHRCNIREADVRSIDNAPLTVQGKVLNGWSGWRGLAITHIDHIGIVRKAHSA